MQFKINNAKLNLRNMHKRNKIKKIRSVMYRSLCQFIQISKLGIFQIEKYRVIRYIA